MKLIESYSLKLVLFAVGSFVISIIAMEIVLPILKRLKAGQSIREEGPKAHQVKAGTPTMGGIAFLISFIITNLFAVFTIKDEYFYASDCLMILFVTAACALIGFSDDYIKVMKKRNLGLTEVQKLGLQIILAIAVAVYTGKFSEMGTMVYIPFWKAYLDFGWFYYPFVVFVIVAMTNAVNLTDGLDGLAGSVTAIVCLILSIGLICLGNANALTGSISAASLFGALLGFLLFNKYPAKVFMGDTGSLALGGALTAIAVSGGMQFILPIAGIIYVLEALSVIIQVFVFKTQNGRRFFRMAPLHHHFELGGMHETKVVLMFCVVTAVMGCAVLLLA